MKNTKAAQELGSLGGKARARNLTKKRISEIGQAAARARWKKEVEGSREYYKKVGWHYVTGIPRKPLPRGIVLVHNQVIPQPVLGANGFRAWTQVLDDTLKVCKCDWAGRDLHGLTHYRKILVRKRKAA
ncbi:MAG TPA: hypothetical protein VNZ56_15725 [Verrucomicrobiae bacterium]|jgi:hypothetical protein|nr:hypothetical protein [Verrucomicrobiae bacterium]